MIQLLQLAPVPLEEMPGGIPETSAVFGTDCSLEKGRHYLVTAASGRGKSTLLHVIYGLRGDYKGDVRLQGRSVRDMTAEEWATCRQEYISMVFQDLRLFPELTAWENLLLKATLTGQRKEEEIQQWCKRLNVNDVIEKPAGILSYGQRQRVAIIRALCQPFSWLLLDEPFSHLDRDNAGRASKLIAEVAAENKAGILLTSLGETHDMDFEEVLQVG